MPRPNADIVESERDRRQRELVAALQYLQAQEQRRQAQAFTNAPPTASPSLIKQQVTPNRAMEPWQVESRSSYTAAQKQLTSQQRTALSSVPQSSLAQRQAASFNIDNPAYQSRFREGLADRLAPQEAGMGLAGVGQWAEQQAGQQARANRYAQGLPSGMGTSTVNVDAYRDEAARQLRAENRGMAPDGLVNQRAYDLATQAAMRQGTGRFQESPNQKFNLATQQIAPLRALESGASRGLREVGEASRIPGAGYVGEKIGQYAVSTTLLEAELALIPGFTVADDIKAAASLLVTGGKASRPVITRLARTGPGRELLAKWGSETGALSFSRQAEQEVKDAILSRIRSNKPIRLAQEEVRSVERGARSEEVGRALHADMSPDETIAAINAARRGKYFAAEFEPAGFPENEVAWMLAKIADSPALGNRNLTKANAVDAIQRMQRGEGLRTFEERILGQVFGDEFVEALKERGTNDLLANIARAWKTPGVDPMKPQEIVPVGERYFTEAVQQGADLETGRTLDELQRMGRGQFGIATRPRTLEQGIEQAMDVPARLGPVEQPTVLRPFADATDRAADEAVTSAINAQILENQLKRGAKPEWMYADEQARALLQTDDPIKSLTLLEKGLAPIQLWRSVVTAFDNSFLGRQGWRMIASNTREWAGAYKRSWQALFSEDAAKQAMAEVEGAAHYALGQRMKRPLAIVTEGGGSRPSEEFLSPYQPPGIKQAQRAHVTSGNWLRQMSLERDIGTWEKTYGPITDDVAQRLIDDINIATMYGNLRGLQDNASLLGQTFFSLRAKASLPQFIMDTVRVMRPGVDPVTRRIIATRFGGWLTMNLSLMYAAKWAGAQTGLIDADMNPFSPKFGKIKAGGQTYDVWGGYAPFVRMVLQTGMNNEHQPGNYIRNQLSPAAGVAYDWSFGGRKDYKGDKILESKESLARYGLDKVSPLFFGDVYDAWKANGFVGLVPAAAGSFSGIGVGEDFGPSEAEQKTEARKAETELAAQKKDAYRDVLYQGVSEATYLKDERWVERLAEKVGMAPQELAALHDVSEMMQVWRQRAIDRGTYPDTEEGRAKASKDFYADPTIKELKAEIKADKVAKWQANPQALQMAIESGAEEWSQEKQDIIDRAGLR